MRWPFGRKGRDGAAEQTPVRPVGEWTLLPPLEPTSGPIAPTAPSEGFVGDLATRRAPALAIAPLAHDRSIEAPHGIVSGRAVPVQRKTNAPDMHYAPAPSRTMTEQEPLTAEVSGAELPAVTPRPLPAVEPTQVDEIPRSLTRSATIDLSPTRTEEPPSDRSAPPVTAAPKIVVEARRPGDTGPPAKSIAQPRTDGPVDAPRRPLGLGAPISALPPNTPSVRRVQRAPLVPHVEPPKPLEQPRIEHAPAQSADAPRPAEHRRAERRREGRPPPSPLNELGSRIEIPSPTHPTDDPRPPSQPTSQASITTPAASEQPVTVERPRPALSLPVVAADPVSRPWPARARREAAPTVGARPRLPSPVQRAPDHVPAAVRTMVERATGADLSGVQVHRGSDVVEAAAAMQARAFTTEGQIHLPLEHGPLDVAPARSLVAHELVHVAQQRRLGSAIPAEDSHEGMRLEAEATSLEHAVINPPSPVSAANVERPAPQRRVPPARSGVSATKAPEIARPPVQRAANEGPAPAPEPPPAPEPAPAAPAAEAAPPAAAGPSAQGPAELDELARRLYDRIRRRITADLRAGREMAGTIADL